MARQINLLKSLCLAIAFVMAAVTPSYAAQSARACTASQKRVGICTSGSTDSRGVTLNGTKQSNAPGKQGKDGLQGTGSRGTSGTYEEPESLWERICGGAAGCDIRTPSNLNPFTGPLADTDPADPAPAVAARAVMIADVARFLPAAAALHAEPEGWAVVGVPANFWVEVSPVTVDGGLLGEDAQVRFTPRGYRFDYGDGSARTTTTAGASWAALGQEELTETATSHLYEERGDRRAAVTVFYSAEYRFAGGPWIGIDGAVVGQAPPLRELVVIERTALTTPTTG